jgi:raffinose/stachyose/melibiose transport system substrate-binding protein
MRSGVSMLAVFARQAMALSGALAILATGCMFSADRSLADQAFAPGTYKLLSFFPQDNYDKWLRGQIAAFQASHQGVTIQVQYTDPTNIIQMIKTGVASGQAPDVATQLPGSAQLQLWQAGQLLDFKPYIDADAEWKGWVKGWGKVPNSQYRDGDHIFAANVSLGPMLVWYWKDMLAKVGYDHLPTDIKGLIELAAALKKADLPSMANGLNSQALFNFDYTFYTLEANWDPDGSKARMADAGKYPWTSPEFKKASDLFKQLYDAGVFYEGALEKNYDPDSKVDFGARKASMAWPFGPWMDGAFPVKEVPSVGVALFPRMDASGPAVLTSSNDLEFIIPIVSDAQKDAAHRNTMVAFVKQLNSPQSQKSLLEQGIFPIMTDVASSTVDPNSWQAVLKAQIDVSNATQYAVDENTYSPNTDTALTNGLQAVLLGKKTVDDMLADVQAANKKDHACAPTCQ